MKILLIHTLLLLLTTTAGQAQESGCTNAANAWTIELNDAKHSEVYRNHARSDCEWAGKWVKKYAQVTDQANRERMCNDLVLIWTHKDCGFFRDVINPDAYTPCKAWSREMFKHCMDNDVKWFP